MLRICFISHQSRLEGAERSLLELIDGLRGEGFWIGVVAGKEEGPLMDELDKREIPWKCVPFPWWTRSTGRPAYPAGPILNQISRAADEIRNVIEEWEADLVYSNTVVIGAGAIAALLAEKPHIWHIREAASQPDSYRFLLSHDQMESLIDRTSNHVIFNSRAVQKAWARAHLDSSKTDVIYNRVDVPQRIEPFGNVSDSGGRPIEGGPEGEEKSRRSPAGKAPAGKGAGAGGRTADVIIPMHNDKFILRCLESVAEHRSPSLNRVYILDDMTSDETLIEEVKQKVEKSGGFFEYRRNPEHLGFVGTCNRGMEMSEYDVILLNSDTLVTEGWVEKLRACARHRSEIATVTPMSNNASLVSLPGLYTDNPDDDPGRTARLLERIAPVDYRDIPTAHGFCVYIKREAIERVGTFDREAFGMGYGEENDLSMRLRNEGMRNVASCRTYVYHKGAQSFGQENKAKMVEKNYKIILERYPEYPSLLREFRHSDPFHDLREPLRIMRRHPWIEDSFNIITAGTVTRWKRQHEAVRAVSKLASDGHDVNLWICGPADESGEYLAELRELASHEGIGERVHFPGAFRDVTGMLRFADLSLVCSAFEPFGRVTVESMLCGTPVVGADGGGTPELIQDGRTGTLYRPGNIDELAEAIKLYIEQPGRLKKHGEQAKKWALDFNRSNRYSSQIGEIIRQAAGQENPALGLEPVIGSLIGGLPEKKPARIAVRAPLRLLREKGSKLKRKLASILNGGRT